MYQRVAASKLNLLYDDYHTANPLATVMPKNDPVSGFRRRRLETFVPVAQKNLFEVGPGEGNTLAFLQKAGWQVQGLEFSQRTADLIKAKHNIEVLVGNFTTLPLTPGSLEVVAAYHVLEHLYNPVEWLQAVRKVLKPGGYLHLQVPNFGSLEASLTKNCWAGLSFPFHVYHFSPQTLQNLLVAQGFELVNCVTYDPAHSPGTTLFSLRNLVKWLPTRKLPWPDWETMLQERMISNKPVVAKLERKKITTQLFDKLIAPPAKALSQAEGWLNRGNVIDVIVRLPQ